MKIKAEPLKDKRIIDIKTKTNDDTIIIELPSDVNIFHKKDVAAAVQWLQSEMPDDIFIQGTIRKAFPDVVEVQKDAL